MELADNVLLCYLFEICEKRETAVGGYEREYWVVMLLDNFAAHVTVDALELFHGAKIHVVGFAPHSSEICQPLDLCINGPLKKALSTAWSGANGLTPRHQSQNLRAQDRVRLLCQPFTQEVCLSISQHLWHTVDVRSCLGDSVHCLYAVYESLQGTLDSYLDLMVVHSLIHGPCRFTRATTCFATAAWYWRLLSLHGIVDQHSALPGSISTRESNSIVSLLMLSLTNKISSNQVCAILVDSLLA